MEISRLEQLPGERQEILYREYSAWARHHHLLVWTTAAFGVTIPISTILLYDNLSPLPYSVIALGAMAALVAAHMLAEGNRRQWADYKSVPNRIELVWKLRDESVNPDTQLSVVSPSKIRVEQWRKTLYVVFGLVLLGTVAAKWFESSTSTTPKYGLLVSQARTTPPCR